jgi:hypothetical protein
VRPEAEGQVPVRLAADVQPVRLGELPLVSIGGGEGR